MRSVDVHPEEVITTRDFPVHNAEVLERYSAMLRDGDDQGIPPVPLVEVELFLPHFDEPEITLLREFLIEHPDVKYFLLNGSHRTTAANLTRRAIRAVVLEALGDIVTARRMTFNGVPYEHGLLDTIDANIRDLVVHFRGTKAFQTVQEKTAKMVEERAIPARALGLSRLAAGLLDIGEDIN
ncbi:MAG: hypothetical protein AAB592_03755 [Patescibacteria group bacterium]